MQKTILLTGATDGIGLATAQLLASQGHHLLIHGRNEKKLQKAKSMINQHPKSGPVDMYIADLSSMSAVATLADEIVQKHTHIDVIINNAGVFKAPDLTSPDNIDVRFAVNTFAPYLLTTKLFPLLTPESRVINVASAAQAPVELDLLTKPPVFADMDAYAQSKLAMIMWSQQMALELNSAGPILIAVNPGSMLGSKMVQQGFGVTGKDISIGADIVTHLSLDDEYSDASGKYFDNDYAEFTPPHPAGSDCNKNIALINAMDEFLTQVLS